MDPKTLSHQLRTARTPDLDRRRWVLGLSTVGIAAGTIVGLYQTGIVKHLPDPPLSVFDSDKVDASTYAYKRADTPDGWPMAISYAVTATLAAAGGKDRAETHPWLPVALAGKIAADVVQAGLLAKEEWAVNEKLCAYCQAATAASAASLAFAIPEAAKALKRWLS